MARYSDGVVILCHSAAAAEEAMATSRQWIAQSGLELHPQETKIDFAKVHPAAVCLAALGSSAAGSGTARLPDASSGSSGPRLRRSSGKQSSRQAAHPAHQWPEHECHRAKAVAKTARLPQPVASGRSTAFTSVLRYGTAFRAGGLAPLKHASARSLADIHGWKRVACECGAFCANARGGGRRAEGSTTAGPTVTLAASGSSTWTRPGSWNSCAASSSQL